MSKIEVNTIESQCGSTVTLGKSGDTVTLASGASQSGFGRTGTVDWDTTVKTASFTAVSGNGYFVNTTSSAITVTLPASPSAGDIVAIKDYAGTFSSNTLTIGRNSSKLDSNAGDKIVSTDHTSLTLVYVDSTQGWKSVEEGTGFIGKTFMSATGGTITTDGDFRIHTFTSPGSFQITQISTCSSENEIDYLVVGGGGGAGHCRGGGAGAGGLRFAANPTNAPQACAPALPLNNYPSGTLITGTVSTFPVTVGAGGGGATSTPQLGSQGSNSVFSTITSAGGGGGSSDSYGFTNPAGPGASGGGGANGGSGGTGNTPPTSPAQGTNGGNAVGGSGGGGAGGAICAGSNAPSPGQGGTGGDGAGFGPTIFGSTNGVPCGSFRYFAGGGGGGSGPATSTAISGGKGGGGDGKSGGQTPGTAAGDDGTVNTGGGGGGGGPTANGGAGGSGIVVLRYRYR